MIIHGQEASFDCSLAEKSLLYFQSILSDRLNNATEKSLQHDQTIQLIGLQTARSSHCRDSTFPNSPGWTNVVSVTNIEDRSAPL
jgi:hypothetical protein